MSYSPFVPYLWPYMYSVFLTLNKTVILLFPATKSRFGHKKGTLDHWWCLKKFQTKGHK
jgi:hypothetical protein